MPIKKKKAKPRDVVDADIVFGEKIRKLRVDRNISQQVLGKKLGISFQQVQKYEKGVNRVSASRLNEMASIFQIEPSDFYGTHKHAEAKSLLNGNDAQTLKMLRAYSRIDDVETQHRLVLLVEAIAERYG